MSQVSQPIEPNAVYSVAEAATLTKIGVNTLRKLARSGHIRSVRVGRKVVRFLGSDLLDFLNQGGSAAPVNAPADQVHRRAARVA